MNGFGTLKFTKKGLELKTKSEFNKELQLVKFKIGDGALNGKDIKELEDLVSTKIDNIYINSKKVKTPNQIEIRAYIDNTTLEEGFFWREIGLYAKDIETGEDILYMYGNAEEFTNYIPNKEVLDERFIKLLINVSDDINVTIENQPNILATLEDLEELKKILDQKLDIPRAKTLIILATGWVQNEVTGYYEYDVVDENVTSSHLIEGYMDIANQEKLADGYIESYDGGYKVITSELPEEAITMHVVSQKTIPVVEDTVQTDNIGDTENTEQEVTE